MRAIIVDDEAAARKALRERCATEQDIDVVGEYADAESALAALPQQSPDLIFLDVKMGRVSGMQLAQLLDPASAPLVVFVTAFDRYALQAFEVNAVDYVLKPFDKQRVSRAIERARRAHTAEASPAERLETLVSQLGGRGSQLVKLLVKAQGRLFLVDADEMVCASIEDGTITISTRDLEGISNYRTIEELVDSLDSDRFWRPHRSHLVNINHIKEVLPWFKSSYILKMADKRQSEVPVSRAQTKRLRELLKM